MIPGLATPSLTIEETHAVISLVSRRDDVLVWYGNGARTPLSGANLVRWVAKTTNLIGDLCDGAAHPVVFLDLPPSWHALVWCVAASCSGGQAVMSSRWIGGDGADTVEQAHHADLVVTSDATMATTLDDTEPGLPVALLTLTPLALAWDGSPCDTAVDAIAETFAQPDDFLAPVKPGIRAVETPGCHRGDPCSVDAHPGAVLLVADERRDVASIITAWTHHRRVICCDDPTLRVTVSAQEGIPITGAHA